MSGLKICEICTRENAGILFDGLKNAKTGFSSVSTMHQFVPNSLKKRLKQYRYCVKKNLLVQNNFVIGFILCV